MVVVALGIAALAGCGKRGGPEGSSPRAGVYHLASSREPTSLVLDDNGTFTVVRETCASYGALECGRWNAAAGAPADVRAKSDMYWPTPESFPSAVLHKLTLHAAPDGGMIAVGESEWAGSFSQRWAPGRRCAACDGATAATVERRCDDPFPSCAVR